MEKCAARKVKHSTGDKTKQKTKQDKTKQKKDINNNKEKKTEKDKIKNIVYAYTLRRAKKLKFCHQGFCFENWQLQYSASES